MPSLRRSAHAALVFLLVAAITGCDKTPTSPTTPTPPATSCTFTVSDGPPSPIDVGGGEFAIAVNAAAGCAWTASSSSEFISTMGATSGNGTGSARFAVQANQGASRNGTVLVAGRTIAIAQSGTVVQTCEFGVDPSSQTVAATATNLSVAITAKSGTDCPWTSSSNDSFISIQSGSSGSGSGTTVLAIAANDGTGRVGTATVAGQTVTVLQESAVTTSCAFSVAPLQPIAPAAGGNVVVTITQTAGDTCPWIAQPQASFLSITGPSSGTGHGSITISVAPNGGSARLGTVVVAGRSVTVSQAAADGACVFKLAPSSWVISAAGGEVGISVTKLQGSSCPWTAESNVPWIAILAGSSGTDSGSVFLRVLPHSAADGREGTVTIAGLTWQVMQNGQAAPCAFGLAPDRLEVGAAVFSIFVYITQTAGSNCGWIAQASAPWLRFNRMSGAIDPPGYSTVSVEGDANTGPGRTGTITVGNATLTVVQAGALPANAAAVISWDSDPSHYVGQGQSRSFTFVGSQFNVILDSAHSRLELIRELTGSEMVNLTMAARTGQPMLPGYYEHAQRFASASNPGLDIGFSGRGCNTSSGRFLVQEAVYGEGNTVQRFHARFEHYCGEQSGTLRGQIWIDAAGSTTPPPLAPLPPPTTSGNTVFTFTSEPGDYIGQGLSGSLSLANAAFTARISSSQQVSIVIRPTGSAAIWTLDFKAGSGLRLPPGVYDPAVDPSTAGVAYLRARGIGICSNSVGKFTVQEASYGTQEEVYRFRATFELRCGGTGPAFRGEIFIVADPWR